MTIEEFIKKYPLAESMRPPVNEDELRKLTDVDGVRILGAPPANVDQRMVPFNRGVPGCHLWIINTSGIPYILERKEITPTLKSGVVKHTNLTGKEKASCGGEFWVDPADETMLYINGCSGRFGPRTPGQLEDAEEVFQQLGYVNLKSFGWDDDANRPAMVLRR